MRRLSLAAIAAAVTISSVPVLFSTDASSDAGLKDVTIYRDAHGVAHIYAPDLYSLWYANGYVQTQDRMWAMDLLRHLGYGEAARVVGPSVLSLDLSTRRDLYTRDELATALQGAPEDLRAALEAYTLGVNRAATEMTLTGRLPAEFIALGHPFEPWTPLDSAAVATFLLARFGTGGGDEIGNSRLLAQLGSTVGTGAEDAFDDVVWAEPTTAYTTIPASEGGYANAGSLIGPKAFGAIPQAQLDAIEAAKDSQTFGLGDHVALDLVASAPPSPYSKLKDLKWGSNALLIDPDLSATGKAMVGGGPQMGYFNPEIPYEIGLHGGGIDATGIGVSGAMGIVLGRTGTFAWTVTSGISDQTDTIALPAAGARSFLWDGDEVPLQCRTEAHAVANPVALTGVALSEGPQDETFPAYAVDTAESDYFLVHQEVCRAPIDGVPSPVVAITTDTYGAPTWFFAQRSSSAYEELPSARNWLSLASKTDLEGFRSVFDDFSYTFNFFFAGKDAAGTEMACYQHVGKQPVRNAALDPRFPTPAGDAWLWTGYLQGVSDAHAELPRDCDPAQGYYANWNNMAQTGWSSGDSRELWGSLHRVERLDKELNDWMVDNPGQKLTVDDLKQVLQTTATCDTLASQIVPSILALDTAGTTDAPVARQALEDWHALDEPWRGTGWATDPVTGNTVDAGSYDDLGHTAYDALLPVLLNNVVGDEEGPFVRAVQFNPSLDDDPHAGDHGEHNNMFAVLVDALSGGTDHDWCDDVTTDDDVETCSEILAASYGDAGLAGAVTLAPTPQHLTTFTSLGVGPAYRMPMTNRATYFHFHVGTDPASSGSLLPPGASGTVTGPEFLQMLGAGAAPPATNWNQLAMWNSFTLKPVWVDEATATAGGTVLQVPVPS